MLLNRLITVTPPWLIAAGARTTPPTTARVRDSILPAGRKHHHMTSQIDSFGHEKCRAITVRAATTDYFHNLFFFFYMNHFNKKNTKKKMPHFSDVQGDVFVQKLKVFSLQ